MTNTTNRAPPGGMPMANVDEAYGQGVAIADTPATIRLFQLIAAKHAILLEAKGLRHSRIRGGVRGLWAKHYGLAAKTRAVVVLDHIKREMEEIRGRIVADNQLELPL